MAILNVPGLSETTAEFRRALEDMASRNNWNVDAIATVMSIESRFKPSAKTKKGTATGLIQFVERTARALGTTTEALRRMSAVEQLPYVEKYYKRFGASASWRPFDYYLAGWGSGVGKPLDHVLATRDDPKIYKGRNLYELNSGLDRDKDGIISVRDVATLIEQHMAAAKGKALDTPLVPPPEQAQSSSPSRSYGSWGAVMADAPAANLRSLSVGSKGSMVGLWQRLLNRHFNAERGIIAVLTEDGVFGPKTFAWTKAFQGTVGLEETGRVDAATWAAL